jgi:hypothetical protein
MTVIIVVFEGESNMKEYLLLCFSVVKVLDGLESKVILYPEGGKVCSCSYGGKSCEQSEV